MASKKNGIPAQASAPAIESRPSAVDCACGHEPPPVQPALPVLHDHHVAATESSCVQPERLWAEAADCRRCARSLLVMLLDSPGWVGRRVERVSFRDDQTAARHVSVDFSLPAQAPRLIHGDAAVRLVPLTMMRRKTLVNFSIDDAAGTPLNLIGMRHAQRLTQRMIEVLAEITPGVDEQCRHVRQLAHDVAFGTQHQMAVAVKAAVSGRSGAAVSALVADPAIRILVERLANNFIVLVTVPEDGGPRRIVRYHYDEPLSLTYKSSGFDPATDTYSRAARELRPWAPRRLAAALGWRSTVVRFPIPSAELARSFHFEVEAPDGVTISAASLTAGRPNDPGAPFSWDFVSGGFPIVGLHATEVPSGSRSRAQVHLRSDRRGWLNASLLSTILSTCLLWATWRLADGPGAAQDTVASGLLAVVAVVLVLVLASSEHAMASRLVSLVRKAAVTSVLLLLLAAGFVTFGLEQQAVLLPTAIGGTLCCATVVMCWSLARVQRRRISPWEQGLWRSRLPPTVEADVSDFASARRTLGFEKAAIMVESSEADNRKSFQWTSAVEENVLERLCAWVDHSPARPPTDQKFLIDSSSGRLPDHAPIWGALPGQAAP